MVRQHVADEKAQIFGLPIGKRGVKRAESEIRVFRQHRPTYHPMKKVSELAAISLADLETDQAVLQKPPKSTRRRRRDVFFRGRCPRGRRETC